MDGIELEIMWGNLVSIVSEQAQALQRTAFSPIVREAGDLATALFDAEARMVAQAIKRARYMGLLPYTSATL